MPNAKVQVVFANENGLPADSFINTWHFDVSAFNDTVGNKIAFALGSFYNADNTNVAVAARLGNAVDRTAGSAKIKCYNELDDDLPPWFETILTPAAAAGSGDLPWEVALCASFKNLSVTTTPERRRRGRVYIGPLNDSVQTETGASVRPSSAVRDDFCDAMERLYGFNDGDITWVVWSKMAGEGFTVEAGWVDNAFDTQRRRGEAVTARTSVTF